MYFSKFPLVEYIYRDNSGTFRKKLSTNILRRIGFTSLSKENNGNFLDYYIKDGETPEIIADKLYADPEYHWLVLLFNDIIHPYKDWPLDSFSLDKYIDRKYKGYSFFLSDGNNGHPNTISFYKDQTVASSSGWSDIHGVYQVADRRARVSEWNTQMSKLDIWNTVPDAWTVEEYVVAVGATGQAVRGKLERFTVATDAVHHFERKEAGSSGGYIRLNPLASAETQGQIPLGATGATFGADGVESGIYRTTPVTFEETLIGMYMGVDGSNNNDNVCTNREYEYRINEEKRNIKLLHPDFVSVAAEEMADILKVEGLIT